MAEHGLAGEHFVQIGITALRAPDGAFLPSVPLYIKVPDCDIGKDTGLSHGERGLCTDIADIFADKFAAYINGCRKEEIEL